MSPTNPDPHLWPVLASAGTADLEPIVSLLSEKSVDWTAPSGVDLDGLRTSVHNELLENGGSSFANMFRGGGPEWAKIVREVAKKLSVPFAVADSTPAIEERVAIAVLERSIDQMTPEELAELRANLERAGLPKDIPLGKGALAAGLAAGRVAGFASYKLLVVVANGVARVLVGRGLSLAAGAALTRLLAVALGPIGWAITGVLTAIDIAGPAYRITIPSVIMVAVLRASQRQRSTNESHRQSPQPNT